MGPETWGVAPGWVSAGRWPFEIDRRLRPGALPQAGLVRAVGPLKLIDALDLGRCPRLS